MENENNNYSGVWIFITMTGGVSWLILIVAKALGLIRLGWLAVLTSCFWIPFLLLLALLILALAAAAAVKMRRRSRTRKINRRIIKQAKAAGAWEPQKAGGRALTLLGQQCNVKRKPGESDKNLRLRIEAAINRLEAEANAKHAREKMDEICAGCWNEGCKADETLRISKIEVCAQIPADAGAYQEEQEGW